MERGGTSNTLRSRLESGSPYLTCAGEGSVTWPHFIVRGAGKWSPACCQVPHHNAASDGRRLAVYTTAPPGFKQHDVTQIREKPPPTLLGGTCHGHWSQSAPRHWALKSWTSGRQPSGSLRRSPRSMACEQ